MFGINWNCQLLLFLQLLYFVTCQSKNDTDEARTYYGKELTPADVPYIVGITVQDLLCTGSIVMPDVVISAAQCFKQNEPQFVKVYVGTNQILEKGIYFQVSSIHIHPEYKAAPLFSIGTYDVAILKLQRKIPADLGKPVEVSMDDWGEDEPPKKCRIAGFGMHKSATFTEKSVGRLHGSVIDVSRSADSCGCATITSAQKKDVICLGEKSADRICYGDYGGAPMVCDHKLVGLAHGQLGCANFTIPVGDIMMCASENLVDIFLWIHPMLHFLADFIPGVEDPQDKRSIGDKNFPGPLVLYTILFQILFLVSTFSK